MKRFFTLVGLITLTLSLGSLAIANRSTAPAQERKNEQEEARNEAKLARLAKITKERAQEIALKRAPGTVESAELEREHGKLVYSFDIRNAKGTIDEIQVSAITGRIVRVEHENKRQEANEKRKEKKENP